MKKSILITGCSSGIGLCAAKTLHERGYRVFATARKAEDVEMLAKLGVESLLLDVNNSASIQQAIQSVLEKTGGTLDALFNNAGYGVAGAVEDLTREMMQAQFETNVFGAMELANLVIPIMRKQGHGRIIQNTSILGIVAFPHRGAYNASKFALEGFSNTLRQELHGTGIFVSILVCGPISTRFRDNFYKSFQETLRGKPSVFTKTYNNMEKNYHEPISKSEQSVTMSADAVVEKLILALESPKPKAHYYITLPAHLFAWMRRLLPDSALDWLVARALKSELE